jgi:hypothetical protein
MGTKEHYEKNKTVILSRQKKYYERNKKRILERQREYVATHKEQHAATCKRWAKENKKKMDEYYAQWRSENRVNIRKVNKEYKDRLRQECFAAYGGRCFCCGEARWEFLAMDHVKGGGNKHRKAEKLRGGGMIHLYLKRRGYPKDFRLSCSNCNSARGFYGYCPHEREPESGISVAC